MKYYKMEKLFAKDFGVARNDRELKKIQRNNPDYDIGYVTASCAYNRRETKEWLENLWKQYQTYAEPNFLEKIRRQSFHAHSWEMYIGVVLLNNDFDLIPSNGIGPDIGFKLDGEKIAWIEAAITTPGEQEDASGFPKSGPIYDSLDPRVSRVTQSLTKKYHKFLEKYKNKIVKEKEPFFIAINGTYTETLMGGRTIEAAVFARGNDVLKRLPTGKFKGGFYELREEIPVNKKGKIINLPTNYFCTKDYEDMSAIIYCEDHIINCPKLKDDIGSNLYIAINSNAKNRVDGLFSFGTEIIIDENRQIIRKVNKKQNEKI